VLRVGVVILGPGGAGKSTFAATLAELTVQLGQECLFILHPGVPKQGPASYGRRVMRRKAYRTTNGTVQKALRKVGLWR
jgi:adenylate kinase family enzyme